MRSRARMRRNRVIPRPRSRAALRRMGLGGTEEYQTARKNA